MPSAEHLTVSLSACKAWFMSLEGCSVLSAQKSFKGLRLGVAGLEGTEEKSLSLTSH